MNNQKVQRGSADVITFVIMLIVTGSLLVYFFRTLSPERWNVAVEWVAGFLKDGYDPYAGILTYVLGSIVATILVTITMYVLGLTMDGFSKLRRNDVDMDLEDPK